MYFLVDYENVNNEGLKGAEYLLREDTVIIFYSQSCEQVQKGYLHRIMESYCRLELCKLKQAGKNALDFYIASRLGEIFGGGYTGKAAIVSKDQGYKAVRDYWKCKEGLSRDVILGISLERCILSAGENKPRTAQIRESLKNVRIETEFARYEERVRMQKALEKAFADTGYQEQLGTIQNLLEKQSGRKVLYLDSVKRFGKKDGLEIYRKMKQLAG